MKRRSGRAAFAAIVALLALAFAGFCSLGGWQVQRTHTART